MWIDCLRISADVCIICEVTLSYREGCGVVLMQRGKIDVGRPRKGAASSAQSAGHPRVRITSKSRGRKSGKKDIDVVNRLTGTLEACDYI